jgi:hypothetical protein
MEIIDFSSPEYLLRNLRITERSSNGDNYGMEARESIAKIIALQITFYTLCALKGFVARDRYPKIVLVGTGFIGSRVLNELVDNGCQPLLRILCRDEAKVKLGIRSSNNIEDLTRGHHVDVLILCIPISEFPNVCREVKRLVTKQTCVISGAFGLRRNKILQALKTPCVFRTYVEPKVVEEAVMTELAFKESNKVNGTYKQVDVSSSMDLNTLSTICKASGFIIMRTPDIRNLIYVLENYYFILKMSKSLSRLEALYSILGPHEIFGNEHKFNITSPAHESNWYSSVFQVLQENVGLHFQRQFCTAIRVDSIPSVTEFSHMSKDDIDDDGLSMIKLKGDDEEEYPVVVNQMHTHDELVAYFKSDNDEGGELS